ncbi:MAG: citrate synthase [Candidatus Heteroscillospira sp.]|jgi:citrate synthase
MTELNPADYFGPELHKRVISEYTIPEKYFTDKVKRGLRNSDGTGVMAGVTKIGRVIGYNIEDGEIIPVPGRLYYRGINVADIVQAHIDRNTFGYEEVAYLLLMGKLPTAGEFEQFDSILSRARRLPHNFNEDMILKAPSRDVMNKLARSVLALYSYDLNPDETSLENMLRQSIELIARFPIIVANAYAAKRHHYDGKSLYIHYPKEELSVAENFLRMLRHDKSYTPEEAHLLDVMMMLHAEHGGGNNSAFVCRALSSSGTDTYSAIAGAVSSLKGPLHGGANSRVRTMFEAVKENVPDPGDDGAMCDFLNLILDRKAGDGSGKIYGLGHAVYTLSDPRAELIKEYARGMAEHKGMAEDYEYLRSIERNGSQLIVERKNLDTPICANIDLYSGFVIRMLGIPDELFTPLFAISRISGWCAHRIEEVMSSKRIMRPAYRAAVKSTPYIPMEERK